MRFVMTISVQHDFVSGTQYFTDAGMFLTWKNRIILQR